MELPEVHRRAALRVEGFRDDEVRRLLRSGALTTVRRGAYVAGTVPDDVVARHAVLVRAEVAHLSEDAVVSHASAAVLHGLPVWGIALDKVHVTRARRTGGRRHPLVHVHSAPLEYHEIVVVDGLPVTSVARTVVDLARTVPFEQAVAVADAVLSAVRGDPPLSRRLQAALAAAVGRATGWRGAPHARRVVGFADGRSESVGESRSRVALALVGLPAPELQWEVVGRTGRLIGRVDFGWPEFCAVGEFDGKIKYGRLLRPGQSAGDAVYAEKVREDALRAEGLWVARWTWPDLADFTATASRLKSHLHRAGTHLPASAHRF